MTKRKGSRRAKKPPHQPPRCRICRSATGPWTREDAFPEWVRKRLRDEYRALAQGRADRRWEQTPRVLLTPVCEACQRRLNTVFEIPARQTLIDMMDGSTVLTPRKQVVIAGWIAKTTLVITMCDERVDASVVEQMRVRLVELMKDGTPADDTTVRVAHVSDTGHGAGQPFLPANWPPERYEIGSVFHLPNLICETLAGPRPVIAQFVEATEGDGRFVCVWPAPITDAVWPPAIALSMADAQALKDEWNRTV